MNVTTLSQTVNQSKSWKKTTSLSPSLSEAWGIHKKFLQKRKETIGSSWSLNWSGPIRYSRINETCISWA